MRDTAVKVGRAVANPYGLKAGLAYAIRHIQIISPSML